MLRVRAKSKGKGEDEGVGEGMVVEGAGKGVGDSVCIEGAGGVGEGMGSIVSEDDRQMAVTYRRSRPCGSGHEQPLRPLRASGA
jgi:hypothetical protein